MDTSTLVLTVLTGFVSIGGVIAMKKMGQYSLKKILVAIICFIIFIMGVYALIKGTTIFEVMKMWENTPIGKYIN